MTNKTIAEQRREVTEAFRGYAARRKNTTNTEMLDRSVWMSDMAVRHTMLVLVAMEKGFIVEAIEAVYFPNPTEPLRKNDIENRIKAFCFSHYLASSTVYGWLAVARKIYLAMTNGN